MRWALITGASAGIGRAFAEVLAADKTNLVLTARRADRLAALAAELRSAYGIEVECVQADLEGFKAPQTIFQFTESRKIAIHLLINNAGFGTFGPFADIDPAREIAMVRVNCGAMVHLTHLYLPGMIERRNGEILILSSTAAYQGTPYMSVYAATKAFDLLFAEGLAQEVKRHGIRVCALCPGSTESEFDALAGIPTERTFMVESAEKVVQTGLAALAAGKHSVISGFANWAGAELQRLAPRRVATAVAEKMFRPAQS